MPTGAEGSCLFLVISFYRQENKTQKQTFPRCLYPLANISSHVTRQNCTTCSCLNQCLLGTGVVTKTVIWDAWQCEKDELSKFWQVLLIWMWERMAVDKQPTISALENMWLSLIAVCLRGPLKEKRAHYSPLHSTLIFISFQPSLSFKH
jgi:hypothetical protein